MAGQASSTVGHGWHTFQIGVASAVLSFNSGAHGLLDVFRQHNMVVGCFTKKVCVRRDMTRIKKMKRKMSAEGKEIRKMRRAQKKGFAVRDEKKGEVYATGYFNFLP